jgi:hypothetical protein
MKSNKDCCFNCSNISLYGDEDLCRACLEHKQITGDLLHFKKKEDVKT